eukprot:6552651-Pyramimonas_sp.AAC.1
MRKDALISTKSCTNKFCNWLLPSALLLRRLPWVSQVSSQSSGGRPTTLRVAPRVEPLAPHPVTILRDVARREGLPRRPRGPVAEPIVVQQ